jgi:hypothetical protein
MSFYFMSETVVKNWEIEQHVLDTNAGKQLS